MRCEAAAVQRAAAELTAEVITLRLRRRLWRERARGYGATDGRRLRCSATTWESRVNGHVCASTAALCSEAMAMMATAGRGRHVAGARRVTLRVKLT